MPKQITETDFDLLSLHTLARVKVFTEMTRLDRRELASLAHQILQEMGRSVDSVEGILIMSALEMTRKDVQTGLLNTTEEVK